MHEFGLAKWIIEDVAERAEQLKPRRVTKIEIELGDLAGVQYESLLFCLESVVKTSKIPDVQILIHRVPGKGRCAVCDELYPLETIFMRCPKCESPNPIIIQGKEFRIASLQVMT